MRWLVVLATALILGGVLLLSACTTEEEAEDEPSATGTPAATAAATKTPTRTPAGAAASSTPRHLVRRPNLPTPTPTAPPATAAPVQTVVLQPTVVSQPTVAPTSAPPPTVVVTVVPTPVPTPMPTPIATPTAAPTPTGPIVFRGRVVGPPLKQEPMGGPCGWSWWVVQVEVDEVVKMEQADGGCGLYGYVPGETIDVLYFAEYVPVAAGDYVEVGEESMFSCACTCCCDGCGLLVRVEIAGSYIRSL